MKAKFMLSTGSSKKRLMHSSSDNEEIMVGNDTVGIIKELFNYFSQKISTRSVTIYGELQFCVRIVLLTYGTIAGKILTENSKVYQTLDTDIEKEKVTIINCAMFYLTKRVSYH